MNHQESIVPRSYSKLSGPPKNMDRIRHKNDQVAEFSAIPLRGYVLSTVTKQETPTDAIYILIRELHRHAERPGAFSAVRELTSEWEGSHLLTRLQLERQVQMLQRPDIESHEAEEILDKLVNIDGLPEHAVSNELLKIGVNAEMPNVSRYNAFVAFLDYGLTILPSETIYNKLGQCVLSVDDDLLAIGAARVLVATCQTDGRAHLEHLLPYVSDDQRRKLLDALLRQTNLQR